MTASQPAADPPGWIARLRRVEARRGDQCTVCGMKKRILETELGPRCRPHAVDLPPPLTIHRDEHDLRHDLEHDEDGPDAA